MAQNSSTTSTTGRPVGGVIAKSHPLFGSGPTVDYWAENGRVHYYDNRNGLKSSVNWRFMAQYTIGAFADMIDEVNNPVTLISDMPFEKTRAKRFLHDIGLVIVAAREQEAVIFARQRAKGRCPEREMLDAGDESAMAPPMYLPSDSAESGHEAFQVVTAGDAALSTPGVAAVAPNPADAQNLLPPQSSEATTPALKLILPD